MSAGLPDRYRVVIERDPSGIDGPFPPQRVAVYGPSGLVTAPISGLTWGQAIRCQGPIAFAFEAGYREAVLQMSKVLRDTTVCAEIVCSPED
mgnify:CR=1 FL=1